MLRVVIDTLSNETEEDADARREKAKWDNYVPAAERRPLDEFADIKSVQAQY